MEWAIKCLLYLGWYTSCVVIVIDEREGRQLRQKISERLVSSISLFRLSAKTSVNEIAILRCPFILNCKNISYYKGGGIKINWRKLSITTWKYLVKKVWRTWNHLYSGIENGEIISSTRFSHSARAKWIGRVERLWYGQVNFQSVTSVTMPTLVPGFKSLPHFY